MHFVAAATANLFRYEVLTWLVQRRQAISFLGKDLADEGLVDFSAKEISMMKGAIDTSDNANQFWGVAHIILQLATWGASVSRFFHGCPLSSHFQQKKPCQCQWKGRMAVRLSQGRWMDTFCQDLLNLPVGAARPFLVKLSRTVQETLLNDFMSCKVAMVQRFKQVFDFWREIPWRICSVGICLMYDGDDEETNLQYVQASKLFAADVLEKWKQEKSLISNRNGNLLFQMARKFCDPEYPGNLFAYMTFWASIPDSKTTMPPQLAKELMKYCSALTIMQQLEAQHHFLNQKLSFGRAALPAATCASLRRRANGDIQDPFFKQEFSRFIGDFSKLVAIKWRHRSDTSLHLDILTAPFEQTPQPLVNQN